MLTLFFTVALVHIVALMSPGLDFFFVPQTAVSCSRKEAMMDVLGIICGVMVWADMALLGLHPVIEEMAWLRTIIMVGEGLCPCWMGYQMLRGALKKQGVVVPTPRVELTQSGRSFLKDLLTSLANPKAIIYSGSVFSLSVGDNVGTGARRGIFALIIVEMLAWFTMVASLFALPKMRRGYQRLAEWIGDSAGVPSIGLGIHLIISH